MTENTYGNGIKCSGATLSVSPFATTSVAVKRPQDYIYHTPVYNEAADEDWSVGCGCIGEYRALEIIKKGKATLEFLKKGDKFRLELFDYEGTSVMGAIEQVVE